MKKQQVNKKDRVRRNNLAESLYYMLKQPHITQRGSLKSIKEILEQEFEEGYLVGFEEGNLK